MLAGLVGGLLIAALILFVVWKLGSPWSSTDYRTIHLWIAIPFVLCCGLAGLVLGCFKATFADDVPACAYERWVKQRERKRE